MRAGPVTSRTGRIEHRTMTAERETGTSQENIEIDRVPERANFRVDHLTLCLKFNAQQDG